MSEKRLIVEGLVNGKKACFLLDTGASVGLIDSSRRKKFGLVVGRRYNGTLVGAGGEMEECHVCNTVVEVHGRKISQFLLSDISGVVSSIRRETGIEILGIIGLPQMKFAGIRIDANDDLVMFE